MPLPNIYIKLFYRNITSQKKRRVHKYEKNNVHYYITDNDGGIRFGKQS